jgi:2-dehydro-3-deoxygalactonokinase
MKEFLSCDWGTTTFRLRLVDIAGAKIVAEENSDQGIAKVFELWKKTDQPEALRFAFFLDRIRQGIQS